MYHQSTNPLLHRPSLHVPVPIHLTNPFIYGPNPINSFILQPYVSSIQLTYSSFDTPSFNHCICRAKLNPSIVPRHTFIIVQYKHRTDHTTHPSNHMYHQPCCLSTVLHNNLFYVCSDSTPQWVSLITNGRYNERSTGTLQLLFRYIKSCFIGKTFYKAA